ncbi:MAG: cobalamin-dependent protein [Eggerthellaceae bacterium]|nr:cobalamin-dependent protein [Eggerthellaceae bacterium]
MNINQLRMVLALAASGSMTITARKLNVTQPALTYQLNNVEKELGFKVFVRSRTGTTLTREGVFFCDELRQVLDDYDEAVRLSRSFAQGASTIKRVKIGTSDVSRTFAELLLHVASGELADNSITTIACGSVSPYELLKRRIIDLWSCSDAVLDTTMVGLDLRFETLFEAALVAHVPVDHPLANSDALAIEDLEGECITLWPRGQVSRASDALRDELETRDIDVQIIDMPIDVPPMVSAGRINAIAIFDEGFIAPSSHRMVKIPLEVPFTDAIGFAYLAERETEFSTVLSAIGEQFERYGEGLDSAGMKDVGGVFALLDNIAKAVHDGVGEDIVPLVQYAIDLGMPAHQILYRGLAEGMSLANEEVNRGVLAGPDMVSAANTMAIGNDMLKDLLAQGEAESRYGKAVIGTVAGDLHETGKNLVGIMLQGRGIDVTDLGVNVPADRFVAHVRSDENCNLVLLSAFRTESRPQVKAVIDALRKEKLRDRVFVMIGGPACDNDLVGQVGADAYTHDAVEAADVAVEFLRY